MSPTISTILFIYFAFKYKIWFLIFKKIKNLKRSTYHYFVHRRTEIFWHRILQVLNYHLSQEPEFSQHFKKISSGATIPLCVTYRILNINITKKNLSETLRLWIISEFVPKPTNLVHFGTGSTNAIFHHNEPLMQLHWFKCSLN